MRETNDNSKTQLIDAIKCGKLEIEAQIWIARRFQELMDEETLVKIAKTTGEMEVTEEILKMVQSEDAQKQVRIDIMLRKISMEVLSKNEELARVKEYRADPKALWEIINRTHKPIVAKEAIQILGDEHNDHNSMKKILIKAHSRSLMSKMVLDYYKERFYRDSSVMNELDRHVMGEIGYYSDDRRLRLVVVDKLSENVDENKETLSRLAQDEDITVASRALRSIMRLPPEEAKERVSKVILGSDSEVIKRQARNYFASLGGVGELLEARIKAPQTKEEWKAKMQRKRGSCVV
jgi:hypothetical protein